MAGGVRALAWKLDQFLYAKQKRTNIVTELCFHLARRRIQHNVKNVTFDFDLWAYRGDQSC